jgi:hypothetical protein
VRAPEERFAVAAFGFRQALTGGVAAARPAPGVTLCYGRLRRLSVAGEGSDRAAVLGARAEDGG